MNAATSTADDDVFSNAAPSIFEPTRGTFSEAAKKAFATVAKAEAERTYDHNMKAIVALRAVRLGAAAPAVVAAPADVAPVPAAAPVAKKRAAPAADAPEDEAAAPVVQKRSRPSAADAPEDEEAAAPVVQKRSRPSAADALAKEAERARTAEEARAVASERKQEGYERARAAYVHSLAEVLAGSFDRRLLMGAFTHALATGQRTSTVLAVSENERTLTCTLAFFGSINACSWQLTANRNIDATPLLEQAARAFLAREDVRAATIKTLSALVPGVELTVSASLSPEGAGYVCTARLTPEPVAEAGDDLEEGEDK